MSRFASKILTLAIVAVLALPPGWCCMLPTSPGGSPDETAASDDCECCCQKTSPAGQSKESPIPPRDPATCWCGYRDLAKPPSADLQFFNDYAIIAGVSWTQEIATITQPLIASDRINPIASQPIYVLDCVWLC